MKHWILKQYNDTAGKPLDLVQPQASEKFGYPLALYTYEPQLTSQLNSALYQVTVEGAQPSATGLVVAPAAITYHYAANGLDVQKTFRFDSTYVVGIEKRSSAMASRCGHWWSGLRGWATWKSSCRLRPRGDGHDLGDQLVCLVAGRQDGFDGRREGQRQCHADAAL